MALFILIILAITLFLLALTAMLAGAVGAAYVLRWVWPAIDLGSATIACLIALLATSYLAGRFINVVSREEIETDDDDDNDDDGDDDDEASRIRRALWRVPPTKEVYVQKRRRRGRRG
jgi:membrane protein implicated in regulation of membrane protease activity